MFRYNDSLYVSLQFNGQELELNEHTVLESLLVVTNVKVGLPTCQMTIRDRTQFFKNRCTLVPDLPFTLRIGTGEKDMETFQMRVFVPGESSMSDEHVYSIVGVHRAAPRYLIESRRDPFRGSVNELLHRIAEECGLTYSGIATADTQVWIPGNAKTHVFVRDAVHHSYIDKLSCLRHAVTGSGELRLRNLTNIKRTDKTPVFWRGSTPEDHSAHYPVYDLRPVTNSGFSNAVTGYGHELVQQTVLDTVSTLVSRVALPGNRKVPLNAVIKKGLSDAARVSFAPIDNGNVHTNYERAAYQNSRISHLFSNQVSFFHGTKTRYDVLDPVVLMQKAAPTDPEDSVSGLYVVSGKALYLQGTNFYEKFEVSRLGISVDKTNTLVKG